jgi:outer membrane protein OmpA-like peptidoglycan-associated protein
MMHRIFLSVLALLAVSACSSDRVLLLPGEDGVPSGAVAVLSQTGQARAVIDKAYTEATIGTDAIDQSRTDAATVEREHGALIRALPTAPRRFIFYFREGTTSLTVKSQSEIGDLFAEVKSRPGADVQIVGHTSTLGSSSANDRLSLQRAKLIAKLLVERGLDPSLVRAAGRGERELLIPTADGVRNARNRRVEILVR